MKRVNVDVVVTWTKDGDIIPVALYWPMDANGSIERFDIEEAVATTKQRYYADTHYGVTYNVTIKGQKRLLFLKDDVWSLETAR